MAKKKIEVSMEQYIIKIFLVGGRDILIGFPTEADYIKAKEQLRKEIHTDSFINFNDSTINANQIEHILYVGKEK